jgi:hypothetical protein
MLPQYLGLERGLVGFWSFDGKTVVGTRVYDQSGQGNHGTLTGSNGRPVRTIGKLGQGLSFDGVDDYVNVTDKAVFDFANSGQYTWSVWMNSDNFTANGGYPTLWSQTESSGNYLSVTKMRGSPVEQAAHAKARVSVDTGARLAQPSSR